ncbi:hypothetical protein D9Q98_004156 [Chlorella vulgaris]|uniref:Zinc finger LSD1-type domain-containing protein n=1 Tax=Chlorella vulgaris TaxID=3077 RepID=A0A9D4YXU6_CHLVU|nr:hypothetical protein D9Q98_004156 [Chlorella vulgaris]
MRPSSGPSAQITCSGCRTVLLYPAGAQNVRCARCTNITAVQAPPSADMAQLCCSNAQCRVMLMYPRGASAVQCSVCGNISDASQANQLSHVVCGGCQVTLAYANGAQSVKCAVCNFVTPATSPSGISAAGPHAQQQQQQQQQQHSQQHSQQQQHPQQQHPQQQRTTVLVENPGSHDVAIGVGLKGE